MFALSRSTSMARVPATAKTRPISVRHSLRLLLSTAAFTDKVVLSFEPELLARAAKVRTTIPDVPKADDHDALYYSSSFQRVTSGRMRGFCNWVIPNRIMVGQYPGLTPETDRPTKAEVQSHMDTIINKAGIDLFCCLQNEVPPQDDDIQWAAAKGKVYLKSPDSLKEFPNPFTQYGPLALSHNAGCRFVHHPIQDLSVPTNTDSLFSLLSDLLIAMEEEDRRLYIHCWGGRGRAGLVSSCLTSLLFPELNAKEVLDLVQAGYSSRDGAKDMARALSRSPQTDTQRAFVRKFVDERQTQGW